MLAEKDSNIADAVMTIKQLSEEEYVKLCCEAQEDRIRCQNGLLNRLEEQSKTIVEQDKAIAEQDKTITQQGKTITQQGKTITQQGKTITKLEEENRKLKELLAGQTNN